MHQSERRREVSKDRLRVVVTRRLPQPVETRLCELFDTRLNETDRPMSEGDLAEALASADVLVPTVTDSIGQRLLARAGKQLRLIANYGAGFDHIDIETAMNRGVTVTNTPDVLTEDTADLAMALILSVPRRLFSSARVLERGEWSGWSPTGFLGHRIHGKRLGIVGMGRIGRAIARRAGAFGLQIHYHNRRRVNLAAEKELGATWWESLDQMLARMDIVSINCPRTPATFHLLSARRLALLKPETYIVNTSRGDVIDEAALTRMLAAGRIAGVGLDVFENEPIPNPRLLNLQDAVLLPHVGSATIEGRIDMGEKVLINIKTFADGHSPPDRVLPSML